MQIDIKTSDVKPLRNTFSHLARRFGDRPASRYQEATYDIQSEANFQYKPLWDPALELYDTRRTAIKMRDWYALKDPRQFYYGAYTIVRARWQEALDRQLEFVEKRQLLQSLPAATRDEFVFALVPLRHYEWGANTNNAHMTAYGFGVAVTQATMMNTMDRLGMAQHISRIGLLIDGNTGETLGVAKQYWMDAPEWQGVRREMEHMFVTRDWFELMVAQNLVSDALVYPLMYQHFDARMAQGRDTALSMLTEYLMRWHEESNKWVDAVIKVVVAESAENKALVTRWVQQWREAHVAALKPLVDRVLKDDADAAMSSTLAALDARCAKLGLA